MKPDLSSETTATQNSRRLADKPTGQRVIIALNPKSGTGARQALAHQLQSLLIAQGLEAEIISDLTQLDRQVDEALDKGQLRTVVAAGGDGTIGLLANRLPAATTFTLFPLGTENLLARHFHIPARAARVAEIIQHGELIAMDAGSANGKLFLVTTSCGLDADVVRRLAVRRTGHIARWSYIRPLWESVFNYPYPRLSIRVDGNLWQDQPCWAFVFNVPRYAINLSIVPEADAFDGQLDIRTFRGSGLWTGIGYMLGILFQQHLRSPDCRYARAQSIEIWADNGAVVPYQVDGDHGGELPLSISVVPGRVRMLVAPAGK